MLSTHSFVLRPAPPFRLDLTVWALRRRTQNAVDQWERERYRRALFVDDTLLELSVVQSAPAEAPQLEVGLQGPHLTPGAEAAACSALTRMLGLHVDLSGFYARAAHDPALRELADRCPVARVGAAPCLSTERRRRAEWPAQLPRRYRPSRRPSFCARPMGTRRGPRVFPPLAARARATRARSGPPREPASVT